MVHMPYYVVFVPRPNRLLFFYILSCAPKMQIPTTIVFSNTPIGQSLRSGSVLFYIFNINSTCTILTVHFM